MQNSSLFDFEFTTDTNYVFRESVWRALYIPNLETVWSVVSPVDENPKINELQKNLSEAFPNLDLEHLRHFTTAFRLRSISYSEFIQGSFVVNANPLGPIYET